MLSGGQRAWRIVAAAVGVLLIVGANLWGSDDHFPFAPFRMFANGRPASGQVTAATVAGHDVGGNPIALRTARLGLRPAEIEGLRRLGQTDGALLQAMVEAYESKYPDRPPLAELRLEQRVFRLHEHKVLGERRVVLARWTRP